MYQAELLATSATPMIGHVRFMKLSCRPNVANEPRAMVTGSHKPVGRDGSICVLAGLSLLKGRMGRNQLPDDFNALVRDRDEFPPALRRSDWFDEHKREKSRRDFSVDRDGP